MMGLWEPEICRVKIKEIKTQNKPLHPLVTVLQYVQKMHGVNNLKKNTFCNFKPFVPCILSTYGIKINWCHYFNFIYILPDLYIFRAHRSILRRVHTAVHTTIGSVSVLFWPCAEHTARAVQTLNQWLCEQLCELSWGWACEPETCRDPAIYI